MYLVYRESVRGRGMRECGGVGNSDSEFKSGISVCLYPTEATVLNIPGSNI